MRSHEKPRRDVSEGTVLDQRGAPKRHISSECALSKTQGNMTISVDWAIGIQLNLSS